VTFKIGDRWGFDYFRDRLFQTRAATAIQSPSLAVNSHGMARQLTKSIAYLKNGVCVSVFRDAQYLQVAVRLILSK
jgi:hypothetical protein